MKKIIVSTILALVCSSAFALHINHATHTNGNGNFTVQAGDNCYKIGSYIQTHQCAGKTIQFIANQASGSPTMCVWKGSWQNGALPPQLGKTGYFSC